MVRILEIILFIIIFLIMYTDINKKYIPNFLNILLLIISVWIKGIFNLESFIIGAGIYVLPMLLIYGYISDLLDREVLGFGDVKLVLGFGGLLFNENYSIIFQVYIFYLFTFLLATIYILFLYVYNLKKRKRLRNRKLAFAPFICIIFLILYIFRGRII